MASAWGISWGSAWGNAWGSVGQVVEPEIPVGGIPKHKREKQEAYKRAFDAALYAKRQREAIERAVELEILGSNGKVLPKLKPPARLDIHYDEIERLASIEDEIDRLLSIEFIVQFLTELKKREYEALALILLMS